MENVEQLVDYMSTKDHTKAQDLFGDIMLAKLGDAMDAEKIRIANTVFNNSNQLELDLDDDSQEEETWTDEEV